MENIKYYCEQKEISRSLRVIKKRLNIFYKALKDVPKFEDEYTVIFNEENKSFYLRLPYTTEKTYDKKFAEIDILTMKRHFGIITKGAFDALQPFMEKK